jgi:HEAT repeat protein
MNPKFLAALLLVAAAAGSAGYFVGRSQAEPRTGRPVVETANDPKDAIERFVAATVRWKGPFRDPIDQLDARQKLDAYKAEVLRFGPSAFGPAVDLLGDPVKLAASQAGLDGVNVDKGKRGSPALDPIVREAVLELLPKLDPERAAPELAARLHNDNETERVRARAAGELAHLDRKVAVPALLDALDKASERAWHGSRAVVEALSALGGSDVEPALLQAFTRPTTSQELRIVVAQALGHLKVKDAVPALENCVRHENRDHYVRREAIRALLRIDPDRADTLTLEQIDRENDEAFKSFLVDVARSRGKIR